MDNRKSEFLVLNNLSSPKNSTIIKIELTLTTGRVRSLKKNTKTDTIKKFLD